MQAPEHQNFSSNLDPHGPTPLAGELVAPAPIDLRFTTLEVVAVGISVWIVSLVAQDGESHWMERVQLLAVYIILGMAFYWLPTPTS